MGNNNYTLLKESKQIIGWDDAPHICRDVFDHFHDVDGKIRPSYLSGNSLKDLDKVLNVIKNYIAVE